MHKDHWHQAAPLVSILYLKPSSSAEWPQHTHTHSQLMDFEESQSELCLSTTPPHPFTFAHVSGGCNLPL